MKNKIKFVTLLFVIVPLCSSLVTNDFYEKVNSIQQTIKSLAKRYCPMRGFNGESYCPNQSKTLSTYEPFIISQEQYQKTQKSSATTIKPNERIQVEHIEKEVSSLEKDLLSIVFESKKNWKAKTSKTFDKKELVPRSISGFGFDRTNREMKFPVYPTNEPIPSNQVVHIARQFNSVKEFIYWVLTPHGRMEAGLYVRSMNVLRTMSNTFGDSTAKLGITQKLFKNFKTTLKNRNPLPEFQQAINSLPPYNKNNPIVKEQYDLVIKLWGTDIALNVNHGGIVYQQTAIKKCFDGDVQGGMVNDIDSIIASKPPNSGYIKFRKLGILEIRGGNPEIRDIRQRISTFRKAPAPIEWDSIPIYHAVSDQTRRSWLKEAVENYIVENKHIPNEIINDITLKELNHYKRRQNTYLVNMNYEQQGRWLVKWNGCPQVNLGRKVYCPWCSLLQPTTQLAAGQHLVSGGPYNTHVVVERDAKSGLARIRMIQGGINRFISAWIRSGCTWVRQYGRHCIKDIGCMDISRLLYRAVCIDCLPKIIRRRANFNQVHTYLSCVCPTF